MISFQNQLQKLYLNGVVAVNLIHLKFVAQTERMKSDRNRDREYDDIQLYDHVKSHWIELFKMFANADYLIDDDSNVVNFHKITVSPAAHK